MKPVVAFGILAVICVCVLILATPSAVDKQAAAAEPAGGSVAMLPQVEIFYVETTRDADLAELESYINKWATANWFEIIAITQTAAPSKIGAQESRLIVTVLYKKCIRSDGR